MIKGSKHTQAAKEAVRKAVIERKKRQGYLVSPKTRKKLSEISKRYWQDQEFRKKMRKARMGRIVTDETRKKISIANKGSKSNFWGGGKTKDCGYILLRKPNHPFHNSRGYVREARLVMERHLERYLKPKEVVHHLNGTKTDNRLKNLKLFANNNEHLSFHRLND